VVVIYRVREKRKFLSRRRQNKQINQFIQKVKKIFLYFLAFKTKKKLWGKKDIF